MKRILLVVFFLLSAAAPYSVSADEVDPAVLRIRQKVVEYENQFNVASTGDAKRAILIDMEKYIRNSGASKEDIAQYLMWTGHCYHRMEHFDQSSRFFAEVRDMPGIGDFWHIDALRMLAQMELFINNNPAKAGDLYKTMLDQINHANDSHVRVTAHGYLKDAYSKGAFALDRQGRFEDAIALRDGALGDNRVRLNSDDRSWLNLENARGYTKAGKGEQAVALYDRIFKENPSFGIANGDIVSFRLEQVASYGYEPDDPRRLGLLLDIWKNKDYGKFPQVLGMGSELMKNFSEAGDLVQSLSIGEELLKRLEYLRANADEATQNHYAIDSQYATALIQLSSKYAQMGNIKRAMELLELFLKEFPNDESAENAKHWLEHLKRNDPLGKLDLTNELGFADMHGANESLSAPLKSADDANPRQGKAASDKAESVKTGAWGKVSVLSMAAAICLVFVGGIFYMRKGRESI